MLPILYTDITLLMRYIDVRVALTLLKNALRLLASLVLLTATSVLAGAEAVPQPAPHASG
jgi:hypothetical protein